MEMTPHLSDAQMAEFLATPASGVDTHLEVCDSCLDETSRLREAVRGLRVGEEKTEDFWKAQEEGIAAKILRWQMRRQLPARRKLLWVAVAAASAALMIATILPRHDSPRAVSPAPSAQLRPDQDHALLIRVEQSLSQDGPEALQPATILAREISPQDFSSSASSHSQQNGEQQ